jgi:hypothetical protein
VVEMSNKIEEIEKNCGYHPLGKCICLDIPIIDPMCQYCKYYPYKEKEQEKEREEQKMEKKKIYRIIDSEYPEDVFYVLLTEAQATAIERFIIWAGLNEYSIEENGEITPVEW